MTTMIDTTAISARGTRMSNEERFVIFASTLGTALYAVLAPFFAPLFFPPGNDTAALLSAFTTYAAGFLVRPFGAMIFGRVGDVVGRKWSFLVTIMLMGSATFLVGFLPTFATIGWGAPMLLVALRLIQGIAVDGEAGGVRQLGVMSAGSRLGRLRPQSPQLRTRGKDEGAIGLRANSTSRTAKWAR